MKFYHMLSTNKNLATIIYKQSTFSH